MVSGEGLKIATSKKEGENGRFMARNGNREAGVLINPSGTRLGDVNAIFSGRGRRHAVHAQPGWLSVKTMVYGNAVWKTDEAVHRVGEKSFVILNDQTEYSLEIDSPKTPARTFVLFFRRGFVEDVHRSLTTRTEKLLDEPRGKLPRTTFAEVTHPSAGTAVKQELDGVYRAWQSGASGIELEEHFRRVAVAMLKMQRLTEKEVCAVPALRATTRMELYRRVERARSRMEERFAQDLPLEDLAGVACLSPFHFLRTFREVYGVTPHRYVMRRRLEEAARLLRGTELPVGTVCSRSGFASVTSFSNLFRARFAMPPGKFRGKKKVLSTDYTD